jgi:exonuclease III
MKGMFWNCRGLRDLAKHTFLHDVAGDNNLDFIALSETNKNSFSTQCLDNFCVGADFIWYWRCPHGMSRGMLMGITDGYRWALLSVYGAAQEEHKEHFLSELVRACTSCGDLPFIVGGDFNIIRNPSEKNNSRYNNK